MAVAYTTGFPTPNMKPIPEPKNTTYINKEKVFNKDAYDKELANFRNNSNDPVAIKYRTDLLTNRYGKLTDEKGNLLFNTTVLEALAKGAYPVTYLDREVEKWAETKLVNSDEYAKTSKDTTI